MRLSCGPNPPLWLILICYGVQVLICRTLWVCGTHTHTHVNKSTTHVISDRGSSYSQPDVKILQCFWPWLSVSTICNVTIGSLWWYSFKLSKKSNHNPKPFICVSPKQTHSSFLPRVAPDSWLSVLLISSLPLQSPWLNGMSTCIIQYVTEQGCLCLSCDATLTLKCGNINDTLKDGVHHVSYSFTCTHIQTDKIR